MKKGIFCSYKNLFKYESLFLRAVTDLRAYLIQKSPWVSDAAHPGIYYQPAGRLLPKHQEIGSSNLAQHFMYSVIRVRDERKLYPVTIS